MTFSLLAKGMDDPHAQLEAIFCMFDNDNDGTLTRQEFEELVQTTVNLNLNALLMSHKGVAAFEQQLAKEFSDENLAFWQAVRDFRAIEVRPLERSTTSQRCALGGPPADPGRRLGLARFALPDRSRRTARHD